MDQQADSISSRPSSVVRAAADGRDYDGNKPPHEIEEDIARTRVRLSATIEALEHELAPGRVIEGPPGRVNVVPPLSFGRDQCTVYARPLRRMTARPEPSTRKRISMPTESRASTASTVVPERSTTRAEISLTNSPPGASCSSYVRSAPAPDCACR